MALSEEKLAVQRAAWQPRQTDYRSGAVWKFAQRVGTARLGPVTHQAALRNAIAARGSDQFDKAVPHCFPEPTR
jgi:hypothetical protein